MPGHGPVTSVGPSSVRGAVDPSGITSGLTLAGSDTGTAVAWLAV